MTLRGRGYARGIPTLTTTDGRLPGDHGGFSHQALFYRDADELRAGVLDFARPALEVGEQVIAALPPRSLRLLRRVLDGALRVIDMSELGRNPARIIPAVRELARDAPRTHLVAEPIWPGRSEAEIREATRHEALINLALSDRPLRTLCPYDAADLDDGILRDAAQTHPLLRDGEREWASESFGGHVVPASCDAALESVPSDATALTFGLDDLSEVRAVVARGAAHLSVERANDLVLAVNELATNALLHGGDHGLVSVWNDPDALLCEVAGPGELADPLAGRRRPGVEGHESRGLWMVNQLCDLVQTRDGPEGLRVRVLMRS